MSSDVPPMPLRPEVVPAYGVNPLWTAEDWQAWDEMNRRRAAACEEWEKLYRHQHSINYVMEMAARAKAKGDYNTEAVYLKIASILTSED